MVFIKPYHYLGSLNSIEKSHINENYLWEGRDHLFFKGGKAAIHFLATKLKLKREDEVCILTSSESNYVSTCVSATLFNYCKISRVLTDQTRLVYVIHEFGVPHPHIREIAQAAKERNLVLVEDCAHAMNSRIFGQRVGVFGDHALYSLSKHLPMGNGGLLVGNELKAGLNGFYDSANAQSVEREFMSFLSVLPALEKRREKNFQFLVNNLPDLALALSYSDGAIPYLTVFKTSGSQELYERTATFIEPHPVHVKDWFAVTTQPFMNETELNKLLDILKHAS